jgi:hypothetical protein
LIHDSKERLNGLGDPDSRIGNEVQSQLLFPPVPRILLWRVEQNPATKADSGALVEDLDGDPTMSLPRRAVVVGDLEVPVLKQRAASRQRLTVDAMVFPRGLLAVARAEDDAEAAGAASLGAGLPARGASREAVRVR